jgi:long-chain fatty acid transport protein
MTGKSLRDSQVFLTGSVGFSLQHLSGSPYRQKSWESDMFRDIMIQVDDSYERRSMNKRQLFTKWLMVGAVGLGFGISEQALANGYKILCVKDAKATSMGEAFVAQADNPSAIAFNPAGLAQLTGNRVNMQATVVNGFTERTSPSGEETDNVDKWQTVPSLFATTDMGHKDMAMGIGVSFPNGLSTEWGKDSFARYVATYSDLIVGDISPAFGMRMTDNLMVGAGVSFYYSKARLEKMLDLGMMAGMPGAMDAESKLDGDGTAWGGMIGTIYKITPRHSVALTYRLPFTVDYSGTYEAAAAGIRSDVDASIDFPAVIVAGYAFKPTDKWTIECDADWTDWNHVDNISVHFKTPGMTDVTQQQDLKNSVAYKVGAEYKYSDNLALRCGYIYDQNATAEETWRPSLPDTDTHFFTGGFGYKTGGVTIDTAVQFVYYATRRINNDVDMNEETSSSTIDGTYRTWAPCASVSATYAF